MGTGIERVGWLYQARRVATQANAGGGAIVIDISLAAGQIAKLVQLIAYNSGTNNLQGQITDEDNVEAMAFASIASAAGVSFRCPSVGGSATTSANMANSVGLMFGPGQKLTVQQTGAGVQNDTLTVAITLLLYNVSTEPTWDKSRSTNQANVSLAASTISAANTLQAVVVNPP